MEQSCIAFMFHHFLCKVTPTFFCDQPIFHHKACGNGSLFPNHQVTRQRNLFRFTTISCYKVVLGNTTTTHRDSYGHTTGTAKSSTDYFGNTNTTYSDSHGRNIGTSSTTTDYFGNTTTTYRDRNGNTQGSSTSTTDYFGNRKTKQRSNNSDTSIWSW